MRSPASAIRPWSIGTKPLMALNRVVLAGPVGADHGDDLAGRDPQIDLRERSQAAEPNRHIVKRQQRVRICRHLKPDDSVRGRAKSGADSDCHV